VRCAYSVLSNNSKAVLNTLGVSPGLGECRASISGRTSSASIPFIPTVVRSPKEGMTASIINEGNEQKALVASGRHVACSLLLRYWFWLRIKLGSDPTTAATRRNKSIGTGQAVLTLGVPAKRRCPRCASRLSAGMRQPCGGSGDLSSQMIT
jgi:hypothetical protein